VEDRYEQLDPISVSISVCLSVCLYVCLSLSVCLPACLPAHLSQKPCVQTSQNFLCMLPVAVVRSCCDDSAICYTLPVLWTTSCFHVTDQMRTQAWSVRRGRLFIITRQVAQLNCAVICSRRLPCFFLLFLHYL